MVLNLIHKPFKKNESTKRWYLQTEVLSPTLGFRRSSSSYPDKYTQTVKACLVKRQVDSLRLP